MEAKAGFVEIAQDSPEGRMLRTKNFRRWIEEAQRLFSEVLSLEAMHDSERDTAERLCLEQEQALSRMADNRAERIWHERCAKVHRIARLFRGGLSEACGGRDLKPTSRWTGLDEDSLREVAEVLGLFDGW